MKRLQRVALVFGLAAFGAASLEAAEINIPTDDIANGVLIVNNYVSVVEVFAEDEAGRSLSLGLVGRGELKEIAIPDALADGFRIKVYPSPHGSLLQYDDFGVRSGDLEIGRDGKIVFWVEPDLTRSLVQRVID